MVNRQVREKETYREEEVRNKESHGEQQRGRQRVKVTHGVEREEEEVRYLRQKWKQEKLVADKKSSTVWSRLQAALACQLLAVSSVGC